MTERDTVAIVGLGLIGGSLARDLAARGTRVLGADLDENTVNDALREGVVHAALGPGLEGLEGADVLVLAVSVSRAPTLLAAAVPRLARARLITDVGSTKRSVLTAAETLGIAERFVGAHPFTGDHRSGWTASRMGLFREARVFLCPAPVSSAEARDLAQCLWRSVGARTETLGAAEHDRRLAWSSHLPQAASTALAVALASAGVPADALGPGGRDTTRLAASSPELWADIALENAEPLGLALAELEGQLRAFRNVLAARDEEGVRDLFARGERWSAGG